MDSSGPPLESSIANGTVGSLAYITNPVQINHFQHIAMEQSRLKIPLLVAVDMVHGQRTIFPVPLAMAATWDPALVEASDAVEARESSAVGLNWTFAPMLDIARDPRWGRIVEGAGEDPVLGAAMAVAQVRGLQGEYIGAPGHILAGPKHFAGYGGVIGGRDYAEVNLSDSDLWNVYLPPFAAAIKAGAGNVMTAYMPLNGVPAAANKWLLTDVLRRDWGFKGFAVSDANNINALVTMGLAKDPTQAAALAINAGEDMESGFVKPAFMNLPAALSAGLISTKTLDDAVRRVLEIKIRLGLFEHPYIDETKVESILSDPAHLVAARVAAEHSAVLLRNENNTLPLSPSIHRIAVIGPLADSKRDTLGPWALDQKLEETVTVLEGLRARAGRDVNGNQSVKVDFTPGLRIPPRKFPSFFDAFLGKKSAPLPPFDPAAEMKRAVDLAVASDVAVLVLGELQDMDGEASSSSTLALPGDQQALLEAVAATGKPVVLLLISARPLELRWASTHVPAIMDIWYPGTEGGAAVANLIFGDANPGGKLPITWPRDVGQVPFPYDNRISHQPAADARRYWNEESTPLYPFGYGLSYTTFTFSNLRIPATAKLGEPITVSVEVHNTGRRKGEEVAQIYIHQRYGSATRPARELKAFRKISLAPGATQTVIFTLGRDQLQYWSATTHTFVLEPSTFDLWAGSDSTAALTRTFTVTPN
jgi:beta-glucosidase